MSRSAWGLESPRDEWWHRAACRDMDPDVFFPSTPPEWDAAKAICRGCPVRQQCLEDALRMPSIPRGVVYGGLGYTALHEMQMARRS